MRFSTLLYTIRQGFANIFRNKWYSLASIATISSCLFLFGIFYAVVANFQYILKTAQEGVAVTVFFTEGISEEQITVLGQQIAARSEVDHINYISAEEAWESFKAEYLGEYADGFTENPLADSANYEIYIKDVSQQASLVEYLNSLKDQGIRQVNQSELTATTLDGINRLVGYVALGIILLLLLVSVFLISNTVTIGISVRKEEINIMKYIGATDFFVRFPFIVEGMLIGALGALIPLGIVYVVYNNVIGFVMNKFTVLSSILNFLPVQDVFHVLLPVSLAIGVGIGFIGSFTTVRKHIRV